jgi:hypothetical protein
MRWGRLWAAQGGAEGRRGAPRDVARPRRAPTVGSWARAAGVAGCSPVPAAPTPGARRALTAGSGWRGRRVESCAKHDVSACFGSRALGWPLLAHAMRLPVPPRPRGAAPFRQVSGSGPSASTRGAQLHLAIAPADQPAAPVAEMSTTGAAHWHRVVVWRRLGYGVAYAVTVKGSFIPASK